MNKIIACILYFFILFPSIGSQANVYKVNNKNSQVIFQVQHFKFGKVKGNFKNFEGSISFNLMDRLNQFNSTGSIEVKSIDTGIKARDEHLLSPEIFNSGKFPQIGFSASQIKEITEHKTYEVFGYLTIKEIRKPIKITMILLEASPTKLIFKANTFIKRSDFKIEWSNIVEGANLVGDKVFVNLLIQADAE